MVIRDNKLLDMDPSTGKLIELVDCTPLTEIPSIIENSLNAQKIWSEMPLLERIHQLKKCTSALPYDRLCEMISKEMGKVELESKEEMSCALDQDKLFEQIMKANSDEVFTGSTVVREPHGVVLLVTPWNFPVSEMLLLALPALGAGNSIIVKPSEFTPVVGKLVVEALQSVLPEGVVQLVQGGETIIEKLVKSNGVSMVAMTESFGSTGKKILQNCACNLKRVVLELGGKDPMIIFKNVLSIEKAAQDAVLFSIYNSGQVCCAIERIYVEESIEEEFLESVLEHVEDFSIGGDTNYQIGPLVSSAHKMHVESQVNEAIGQGAKLLYQCEINVPYQECFYPLTVLSNVSQSMDIFQKETYGPVICIASFDGTEEKAIELANDSQYGMASYIYTSDLIKAKRIAKKIKTGQVGINCYSLIHSSPGCPWVGHKQSGYGFHTGIEGLRQFSLPKSIVFGT